MKYRWLQEKLFWSFAEFEIGMRRSREEKVGGASRKVLLRREVHDGGVWVGVSQNEKWKSFQRG